MWERANSLTMNSQKLTIGQATDKFYSEFLLSKGLATESIKCHFRPRNSVSTLGSHVAHQLRSLYSVLQHLSLADHPD